jgi:hypothetical protein
LKQKNRLNLIDFHGAFCELSDTLRHLVSDFLLFFQQRIGLVLAVFYLSAQGGLSS